MTTCKPGDIVQHKLAGTYLRIGHPHPDTTRHAIWAQDCDANGHLTAPHGRYLSTNTLTSHYRHHATPTERYDR